MIDLEDCKARELFVDSDEDYWLSAEHGQWLLFYRSGRVGVGGSPLPSRSPRPAKPEEIKAFCDRFMPVVPTAIEAERAYRKQGAKP